MYGPGPGQSMPRQPMPPQPVPPSPSLPPHGQPPQPMPPPQPPQLPYPQQPQRASSMRPSWLLAIATAAVLIVTGGLNAFWGPWGYLHDANAGVLVVSGNPVFLAIAQTVCGLAWLVFGILLLTGRRFAWGGALVSAGVFAVFESYFIVRGAVAHYVGLFLAVAVFALLHQNGVRRHCKVGPPSR